MGIAQDIEAEGGWHAALAALAWQFDLGVTEIIGEEPVDRYDLPDAAPAMPKAAPVEVLIPKKGVPAFVEPVAPPDPVLVARELAARAKDLPALQAAMAGFDLCDLKRGARMIFAEGAAAARVMVICEPPTRDEDIAGQMFLGPQGALLDAMFAAIGLARSDLYVVPVMPWNPPTREAAEQAMAMLCPFVERHITLALPEVVVLLGQTPCLALMGGKGLSRVRGHWGAIAGRPSLALTHPARLLGDGEGKAEAWGDLLMLLARLRDGVA